MILCGLPCTGKTSCGSLLSEMIEMPFKDLDYEIESFYADRYSLPLSCRGIWEKQGERAFRELEEEMLQASLSEPGILALGGGVVESVKCRQVLQTNENLVVWLDADPKELWSRVMLKGIPTYLDSSNLYSSFQQLATRRYPFYQEVSDLHVDVRGKSQEQVVEELHTLYEENYG